MAKFLISVTETYRVGTEQEAKELIENSKHENYTLTKYTNEHKEKRSKGEIVDEFQKVTLTKTFTDIKEPDMQVTPVYKEEVE